jgi:hypothetical protein
VDANQTAKLSFLPEPEHTWCYYFAKAELARQQGHWDQVIELIDEARSYGYEPEDPFEWLLYIEARALTGKIKDAEKLSEDVLKEDNGIRRGLCELWKRVQVQDPMKAEEEPPINQTISRLNCIQSE